jgi:acetyl esterase/lipase
MIAFAADYRVGSRHQAKVFDCIADAKSAIRWVRSHAEKFHIDRARIVAAGGSAGGHLAACTALIDEFEEASEDKGVSSHPNAMVLFNPAVMLAPGDTIDEDSLQRTLRPFERRFGVEPTRISPFHHVKKGICPTLILHGKNDRIVPYQTVELFEQAMTKDGNDCRLVGYEGQSHGFFNKRGNNDKYFHATLRELDEFLTSIKFLEGEPTIGQP